MMIMDNNYERVLWALYKKDFSIMAAPADIDNTDCESNKKVFAVKLSWNLHAGDKEKKYKNMLVAKLD